MRINGHSILKSIDIVIVIIIILYLSTHFTYNFMYSKFVTRWLRNMNFISDIISLNRLDLVKLLPVFVYVHILYMWYRLTGFATLLKTVVHPCLPCSVLKDNYSYTCYHRGPVNFWTLIEFVQWYHKKSEG